MPEVNRKDDLQPSFEDQFDLDPETSAERTGIHSAGMAERAKPGPLHRATPDISGLVASHTAELQLIDDPVVGSNSKPGLRDDEKKPASVADPNPDRKSKRGDKKPAPKKGKNQKSYTGRAGVIANADNGPPEYR